MHIERATQVIDLIKANPSHHDQKNWHCGTSHCFANMIALNLSVTEELPTESNTTGYIQYNKLSPASQELVPPHLIDRDNEIDASLLPRSGWA